MTYQVVGCSECSSLWILEHTGDESAICPTCGTKHQRQNLRPKATAEESDVAAQKRSALLADRRGEADADLDAYWLQEDRAANPIVDDREYLDGLGLEDELVDELTLDQTETITTGRGSITSSAGTGPDVDVEVADRSQLSGVANEDALSTGVTLITPESQLGNAGHIYRDVSPRTSEWLGDVIEDQIPSTARLVQELAADRGNFDYRDPDVDAGTVEAFTQYELVQDVAGLERIDEDGTLVQQTVDADVGTIEEARSYLDAISRYALLWADDVYRLRRGFEGEQQFERIQRTLETTGTSHGQFNAGVDALRHSLAALHAERDVPLPQTFVLDGQEWTGSDAETIKRALATFDVLADGFDVRLWMSPGIRQRVRRLVRNALGEDDDEAAPAWAERFEFLTEAGTTSRRPEDVDELREQAKEGKDAWEIIDDNATQTGLLTTLAHLDTGDTRSVKALKQDNGIDYADASIDRYLADLEAMDLIEVDRAHASNRVALTPLGETAQDYVDLEGNVVHPDQSQLLGASYGRPPASHKHSVSRQQTGGDHHPPAELWMAETGDPGEEGYEQWLGDAGGPRSVEPPEMHRRILAGERVSGVNFVDADIIDWTDDRQAPNGDGRVSYTSVFDDHALVVTQWGGPAQILARLCSALLSNKMFSKALDLDAVGKQFENLHDGVDSFENDIHEVMTRSHQMGWLSEDELDHYLNFRERWGSVRSRLLSRVAEIHDLDSGLRSELFDDLHGLLCSATHLYRAAGIDVTFNIRLPRTKELLGNEVALQDFLNFMRYSVTKQAGYEDQNGFHSIFRMLQEDRPQKLRSRASYEIGDDPTADLTASWIISGPDATSLREHVQDAVAKESSRLRERVREGVEEAAVLDIPMVEANSHAHIRGLVRDVAERKGFNETHRDDLDRLTRCLEAALARDNHGPDPFLVADALHSLESRDKVYDRLDTRSVENALASLPETAIFPSLPPSARKMISALFASDEPLDRQDLIEVTSTNSYDRHHRKLRAFFLVEETETGFVAHLEPWWSSTTDDRQPYHEPHPSPQPQPAGGHIKQSSPSTAPGNVIMEVVAETEFVEIPPDRYYEIGKRIDDVEWLLEELDLEEWRPVLRAFCDGWHEQDIQSYSDPPRVKIAGQQPDTTGSQTTLATVAAE